MQVFMKGCALAALALAVSAGTAAAQDPESCKTVRFSDVGWTDITATTAVTTDHPAGARLQDRHLRSSRCR